MLEPDKIKLEARLMALDYLVAKLIDALFSKSTDAQFAEWRLNHELGLEAITIPGTDAASADVVTSEFRDAVLSVLNFAEAMRRPDRKS